MPEALLAQLCIRRLGFKEKLVVLINHDSADSVWLRGVSSGGDGRVVDLKMGLLGIEGRLRRPWAFRVWSLGN